MGLNQVGDINIINSTFIGNSALGGNTTTNNEDNPCGDQSGVGGAITIYSQHNNCSVLIQGCSFQNNFARGGDCNGGV